jgi:hypothetical protein
LHGGAALGQEVLDDHLLDVTVPGMAGRDRPQRHETIGPGLADADEDARREGDLKGSGGFEGGEPTGRGLVRRDTVTSQ